MDRSAGQTNNIIIYSEGNIVLSPQTTNLTELATTLPVAVFNPGGILTLLAGVTLSADGATATRWSSSATITSADAGDTTPYYDVWTGNYDINGASQFNDNFSTSNSGGLDTTWTVQSGSFTVDTASQTATATGTSGNNLATVTSGDSINSVNESAQATISGTLASGQEAGLVALFTSPNTYYYGSITATSSSTYTASIYSVVNGGTPTPLGTPQSYNGSVSDAVLEFSVAGSSLTLLLNGKRGSQRHKLEHHDCWRCGHAGLVRRQLHQFQQCAVAANRKQYIGSLGHDAGQRVIHEHAVGAHCQ